MVGAPQPAVIGQAGYAWGDGVHGVGAPAGRAGTSKREGDGRSPAGVFALGTVHGTASDLDTRLPYQKIAEDQVCIDDPTSAHYNRVVSKRDVAPDFRSAEPLRRSDGMYDVAIDVEHNRSPVVAGHGSCIFIHPWAGPDTRLPGCTGVAKSDALALARWLTPHGALLVALPSREYQALRAAWMLP
jgi:L,D-peptidoglycan transpeptidase YkuD (ErfK/YbiS/YcfS/YnhG family)